jgi:hypothetical protein
MIFIPLSRAHDMLSRSLNRQSLGGLNRVPTLTEFRVMSDKRRAKLANLVLKLAVPQDQGCKGDNQ